MIVTGEVLGQFMHEKIGLPFASDTRYIGVQREDLSIAGAVAYNCWLEESVFMHVYFESHAVTRQMLREAFSYPFVTCGKSRVYGLTPITSIRALRFSKSLGFKELQRSPDFLLQMMTRQDCRWINDATSATGRNSGDATSPALSAFT